ncbi:MAG TPA: redoxin domain-containing protein [Tepidisphaeraceae bacterium]|jgi:hypothetical protein
MRIAQGKRCRRTAAAALLAACVLVPAGITRAADDGSASAASASAADSGTSMARQIVDLRKSFNDAQAAAYQAYAASQGKPDDERARIYQEKVPKPHPYAQKAMALAIENPSDPAAADALLFVVEITSRGNVSSEDARLQTEAIDQLSRDHVDDPRIANVFSIFQYSPSRAGDKLMRLAAEKSKSRDVRGSAIFWVAQSIKRSSEQTGDAQQLAEAKKLYKQVAAEYADVKSGDATLGERATANLFQVENLAIGKTAPEITGKDANGKPLKLSDYRGKVVVLDFWGDW